MSTPIPAGHQAAALGALAVHQHENNLGSWSMIRLDETLRTLVVYVPAEHHKAWAESLTQYVTRTPLGSLVTDGTLPDVGVRIRVRSAAPAKQARPQRRHLTAVRT